VRPLKLFTFHLKGLILISRPLKVMHNTIITTDIIQVTTNKFDAMSVCVIYLNCNIVICASPWTGSSYIQN
jgi:hypothetical protein